MSLRAKIGTVYAVLCVVWGSTYIAIRIGVHHLPPALLGGLRFVVAGLILLAIGRGLGDTLPTARRDWQTNVVVGLLLLAGANGLVMWAEQFVSAGVASIFVVTVALWMAVFDAIIPGSPSRPTPTQFVALLTGFAGTLLLVGTNLAELRAADWRGPVALTVASILWSLGSIYGQRRTPRTSGAYVNSAIQQLSGGIVLLAIATGAGEWNGVTLSWPGVAAVLYLVLFGSIIGFTAFVYVMKHLPATMAGTYVYANAVVAVFLGWALLGEAVTGRTFVSMAIVIGAVVWVRAARRKPEDGRTDVRRTENRRTGGLLGRRTETAGGGYG